MQPAIARGCGLDVHKKTVAASLRWHLARTPASVIRLSASGTSSIERPSRLWSRSRRS